MSWRTLIRRLNEARDVKRAVYRAHRIAGLLLYVGALYVLDRLWFAYEPKVLSPLLQGWAHGELGALFGKSLWVFLIAGNMAALAVSLVVVFRPSLLKGLESWTDRVYGRRNCS